MEREKNMIKTGKYRNYGQMNDQARKETTVEEYAWQLGLLNAQNNDELVPVEPIEEEIKYKTMIQDNRAIA